MTVPPPPGGATPPPPPPPPPSMPPMPPGGAHPSSQSNGMAVGSLVLGILSLVCFGVLTGIPAVILGILGKKKSNEIGGEGSGQAVAGIVLGIIGTIIWITVWLFLFVIGNEAEDAVDRSIERSNRQFEQQQKEFEDRQDRNEQVADSDHYKISNIEIEDTGFSATWSAFIENRAEFESGYTVDVTCQAPNGETKTESGYAYSLKEGNREKLSIYFSFEDSSGVTCDIDEVRYS